MAHETHHLVDEKSKVPSISAFWYAVILVGLFIAAVNFVHIMNNSSEHEATPAHPTQHTGH